MIDLDKFIVEMPEKHQRVVAGDYCTDDAPLETVYMSVEARLADPIWLAAQLEIKDDLIAELRAERTSGCEVQR